MPLYFAYGANMDVAAMARRCPRSRPLGPARLPRHRFIVTSDGYASAVRDPREDVHGVLWECSLGDVRTLDAFESIGTGLYVKINQPVIVPGGAKRALVYIASNGKVGQPRPGYLEEIVASAREWALPEAYIAGLIRFLSKPMRENRPAPLAPGPVAGVRPRFAAPGPGVLGHAEEAPADEP